MTTEPTGKTSLEDAEAAVKLQNAKEEVRRLLEELEKLHGSGIDRERLEAELREIHRNLEGIPPFRGGPLPPPPPPPPAGGSANKR